MNDGEKRQIVIPEWELFRSEESIRRQEQSGLLEAVPSNSRVNLISRVSYVKNVFSEFPSQMIPQMQM